MMCFILVILFAYHASGASTPDATGVPFEDTFDNFEKKRWLQDEGNRHCWRKRGCMWASRQNLQYDSSNMLTITMRNDCNESHCCKDSKKCTLYSSGQLTSRKYYSYGSFHFSLGIGEGRFVDAEKSSEIELSEVADFSSPETSQGDSYDKNMAPNKEGDKKKIETTMNNHLISYHSSQNTPPNQGNATQSPSYMVEEGDIPFDPPEDDDRAVSEWSNSNFEENDFSTNEPYTTSQPTRDIQSTEAIPELTWAQFCIVLLVVAWYLANRVWVEISFCIKSFKTRKATIGARFDSYIYSKEVDLPFDASTRISDFSIDWFPDRIVWNVDGDTIGGIYDDYTFPVSKMNIPLRIKLFIAPTSASIHSHFHKVLDVIEYQMDCYFASYKRYESYDKMDLFILNDQENYCKIMVLIICTCIILCIVFYYRSREQQTDPNGYVKMSSE